MTGTRWTAGLGVVALILLGTVLGRGVAAVEGAVPAQGSTVIAFTPNGLQGESVAERAARYRRLKEIGVSAIRLDMTWTDVEPAGPPPRDYDFTDLDGEVEAITTAGLKVIGLLAYGHPDYSTAGGGLEGSPTQGEGVPPFGIGSSHYVPPDDPADFAAYAAAVADHYGHEVIAWEVWNEQNQGWRFWLPHEDPAAYADLLCEANQALKSVDPETPVVFGGLFFPAVPPGLPGMSGPQFVRAAYQARPEVGRCFDVLAYHPYPYPFTAPELEVPVRGSVLSAAGAMREAMPPADRDRPLWITEVGWPTHDGYGVDEATQAEYVARMQVATAAQGLPLLNWYTVGDEPDPTRGNQESHFGFYRTDGSPKPAVPALATAAAMLDGARFVADRSGELGMPEGRELVSGGGFAYEFARPEATVTALWYANESAVEGQGPAPDGATATPESVTVTLTVDGDRVEIVDHFGGRRTVEVPDGRVELTVDSAPQYVVVPAQHRSNSDPETRQRTTPPETATELPATGGGLPHGMLVVVAAFLLGIGSRSMSRLPRTGDAPVRR